MIRRLPSRIGLVLLAAAVVLAAVGGAAVGLGAPSWLAGAVAAVSALVAATVVDRYFHTRDERDAALQRRRKVLDKLRPESPWDGSSVLELLRADRSLVPAWGRTRELKGLESWLADEGACPASLVSGRAGVGKSRLVLEFASRLPSGWETGWLHDAKGGEAVGAVRACGDPTVILVDDADGRTDLVPLLNALAEEPSGSAIRVVIVTRSADGLPKVLASRLGQRHKWIATKATKIDLQPVGVYEDHDRWFKETVSKFAEILKMTVPNLLDRSPPGQPGTAEPFLILQAKALLAVLGAADEGDIRKLSFEQVAEELMESEKGRWYRIAEASPWGTGSFPSEMEQDRSIAALVLLGSSDKGEAAQILRRILQLRDANAERLSNIVAWISKLYPEGPGGAPLIQPDMFGEWFVVSQLTDNPDFARSLRNGMTEPQAARALGFLARAADQMESAGPLFEEFGAGEIRRRVLAAAQAALTGEAGRRLLDPVVARQIRSADGWTVDQLAQLEQLIPEHVLPLAHAAIAELTVILYRSLAADSPAAHRAALARALTSLNEKLERVGRYRDALDAGQEAVAMYRSLAADDPAADRAGLAWALINLGITLEKLGRYRDALDAGEEAIAMYRALAADNHAAHRAGLAWALANLSDRLIWVDRYRDALAAAEEAVAMYRALAADNPAVHRAGLASALDGLSWSFERVGNYPDALAAGREAVTKYRALAADNPAHQAALAEALKGLGVWFERQGLYQDSVATTEESLSMFRALAADNPAAYRRDVAWTLNNLTYMLPKAGRHKDAVAAGREAVTLYRALAADNPAAHQEQLAWGLWDLGFALDEAGNPSEALASKKESVGIYRELASRDSDLYQEKYRQNLGQLQREYDQRDMHQEAILLNIDNPSDRPPPPPSHA